MPRTVDHDRARRIAVRAQLLDGSATGVLDTVRRLGFLQIDPIATVATPQELVLWSRLGAFDRGELDRLLWAERQLFEWNALIWPVESLPMVRVWMRAYRRANTTARDRWWREFLQKNQGFRRYVLRELERRGPLLSRDLEDRSAERGQRHRWHGTRHVGRMLEILQLRGEIAIVGRSGGQRLWDVADRWQPADDHPLTRREADRLFAEQRFRALGVRLVKGEWRAHPGRRGRPGGRPRHGAVAVRPADPRPRPSRGAVRLSLPAGDVRPARQARVRLLRAAGASRRPHRRPDRAALRPANRRDAGAGPLGRHVSASIRCWSGCAASCGRRRAPAGDVRGRICKVARCRSTWERWS